MKLKEIIGMDKRLAPLMVGWLINSLGFGAVVPFMTVYFHTERGISMSYISLFFLAAAICRTLTQSAGGTLSDYIGRRGLMIWSQLSRSVIFLAAGIAIQLDFSIWMLAGILLSQYLLSSLFQPVASAMISDILPADKRSNGYALMRMAGNIGWGAGPAIGGFLFAVSYESLFYFTAVTFFISGIFVTVSVKETAERSAGQRASGFFGYRKKDQETPVRTEAEPKTRRRERQGFAAMAAAFRRDRTFFLFCIIALLLFITWGQFVSTLSVFMKKYVGLSSTNIGWLYTFNALLVIIFQIFVTHRTRKMNNYLLMIIGTLLFALSYAFMGWMTSFTMMLIIIVFITFGEMFAGPSGHTIASNMARRKLYGRYQGIYSSISTLGWSLGPFIGGIFMDLISDIRLFWLSMSSFGFLALIGFIFLYIKTKEKPAYESMEKQSPGPEL
ncbi:MAG: MFS transporter [Fidelibacterota bacterium]